MSHKRSKTGKQKQLMRTETYAEKQSRLFDQRTILLQYSFRDLVNTDIVYTQDNQKIIYDQLKLVFGEGYSPITAEYGEVLNRFGA